MRLRQPGHLLMCARPTWQEAAALACRSSGIAPTLCCGEARHIAGLTCHSLCPPRFSFHLQTHADASTKPISLSQQCRTTLLPPLRHPPKPGHPSCKPPTPELQTHHLTTADFQAHSAGTARPSRLWLPQSRAAPAPHSPHPPPPTQPNPARAGLPGAAPQAPAPTAPPPAARTAP
jgi:hypothetical protein